MAAKNRNMKLPETAQFEVPATWPRIELENVPVGPYASIEYLYSDDLHDKYLVTITHAGYATAAGWLMAEMYYKTLELRDKK